nr:MAG TPA: hypothetical protein [Caudoviricetes sp.]
MPKNNRYMVKCLWLLQFATFWNKVAIRFPF